VFGGPSERGGLGAPSFLRCQDGPKSCRVSLTLTGRRDLKRHMREYFRNIYLTVKTILIGLRITLQYCFARTITVQYPDAPPTLKPRFRGFHYYEIEKCIACELCAKACRLTALPWSRPRLGRWTRRPAWRWAVRWCDTRLTTRRACSVLCARIPARRTASTWQHP